MKQNENKRDNIDLTVKGMIQVSLLDINENLMNYQDWGTDSSESENFIERIIVDIERVLGLTCKYWGEHWSEDCYPSLCHNPTEVATELEAPLFDEELFIFVK